MKHIMLRAILCMATITMTISAFAQDVIETTDAHKIKAKIVEVSKTEVRYKEFDNLEGPTFVLEIKEISSITYANGKEVVYNKTISNAEPAPQTAAAIDASTAEIEFLSGNTVIAQISALKSNYIIYSLNGTDYTVPSSQIEKVTFLQNGQVKEYHGQGAKVVAEPATASANTTTVSTTTAAKSSVDKNSGRIYRDNGHYLHNDTYISAKEVQRILEREDKEAYNAWKKAEGMSIGGAVCIGVGAGLAVGGLVCLIFKDYTACIGMDCAALVPLGVGLGLTLGASSHYNKAIDIYNSKFDHAAVQLRWGVSANGVGLALAF